MRVLCLSVSASVCVLHERHESHSGDNMPQKLGRDDGDGGTAEAKGEREEEMVKGKDETIEK